MHHELKCEPHFFKRVLEGSKTFEIRDDRDRSFQAGDSVMLLEYSRGEEEILSGRYTGRRLRAKIGYVSAFNQHPGFVVFSLLDVQPVAMHE